MRKLRAFAEETTAPLVERTSPMTEIERDAARYRWIKAAPRLRIERMPDSHFWISADTPKKYCVTHTLTAFDTGFSGLPTLDDLVDQAMEMYPIPKTND
jgi:hypothetical protein